MPTYSYECQKCEAVTDVFHSMSATPKVTCGSCGSRRVKRLMGTGAGIIFKGSGFYETDYKNGSKGKPESKESKSEGKTESKSESKSEGKSESKTESKSTSTSTGGGEAA